MTDLPLEQDAADADRTRSIDPYTGDCWATQPHDDANRRESVLATAAATFAAFRVAGRSGRSECLRRLAEILRAESDDFATRITREMGKPITAARAEVAKCASLCDWYADHADALLAPIPLDVGGDGEAILAHLPLGVVLGIMPWNFPLWQVLRAAVPIIAAGNGFVLKHADNVQATALALRDAFLRAGFVPGTFDVLNIGVEALPSLIADPRIAGVTVTAGVAAGRAVAAEAGRHLKKCVLELGGSDPFVVLADADVDRAADVAVEARFQNGGQVCIAAKRLILEQRIADRFIDRFVAQARELSAGDPRSSRTRLGPLARPRLRDEVHRQVTDSVAMGATLLLGGTVPDGPAAFYPATVLTGVTPDMPVFREETFGPVAAICVVRDAEEAIRVANDSAYGLSASLWTGDVARGEQLARRIDSGSVFVNGMSVSDPRVPIGGIKHSGFGRELSWFGLREFCNVQTMWRRP